MIVTLINYLICGLKWVSGSVTPQTPGRGFLINSSLSSADFNYEIVHADDTHFELSCISISSPMLIENCRSNAPISINKLRLI